MGFVEGVKNAIRVTQRRCYALGDEKPLRLKVLIGMLDLYEADENHLLGNEKL